MVHGGVVSALFDELLGWAVVLQTGRMCFTVELAVRFVKPIWVGTQYVATAGPGTEQGRYWESEGGLRDVDGALHAKAHGRYFLLSEQQTAEVVERMTYQPDDLPVFRAKQMSGCSTFHVHSKG
jgi:acyl-coenzyme A thioesterase PaaI-like protein